MAAGMPHAPAPVAMAPPTAFARPPKNPPEKSRATSAASTKPPTRKNGAELRAPSGGSPMPARYVPRYFM